MPLTLLLAKAAASPQREGRRPSALRDRRFEALLAKSFAEMRCRGHRAD